MRATTERSSRHARWCLPATRSWATFASRSGCMSPSSSIDAPGTRVLASVSVVDSPLITAVIEYARRLSEPYLFNHAMRSWLFSEAIGRMKGIVYDHEVVAVGTILHDLGLTASIPGPDRFEVN